MTDAPNASIYPRYCFHLAPTAGEWCPFRASEIHDLAQYDGFEGENFYFYKNLPIKWVRIVGVVVAIDDFYGKRAYTIDDSSGACIEALVDMPTTNAAHGSTKISDAKPAPSTINAEVADVDVGAVVEVKGGISTFRDQRQIKIERMVTLRSTAQEVTLWAKRVRFRREVLDRPWTLREREIRRCRKDAERSETDEERKRKRLKAAAQGASITRNHMQASSVRAKTKTSKESRGVSAEAIRSVLQDEASQGKYKALGL